MTRVVISSLATAVFVARLETITEENGYSVTLANVAAESRAALWDPQGESDLPYLKLFTLTDSPVTENEGGLKTSQDRRRTYQIEFRMLVPDGGDYMPALNDVQVDIMAALATEKLTGIGIDEFDIRGVNLDVTYDHPENPGAMTAGFSGELSFTYTQNL